MKLGQQYYFRRHGMNYYGVLISYDNEAAVIMRDYVFTEADCFNASDLIVCVPLSDVSLNLEDLDKSKYPHVY